MKGREERERELGNQTLLLQSSSASSFVPSPLFQQFVSKDLFRMGRGIVS